MITTPALGAGIVTLLTFAGNIASRILGIQKRDSLASFTRATRIEPIALVDKSISHQPWMTDLMQSAVSIFTGYYLQAVALTNVSVSGVSALKVLDSLNPNRDVRDAAATMLTTKLSSESLMSGEAYRYGLPSPRKTYSAEDYPGVDSMRRFNEYEEERRAKEGAKKPSTAGVNDAVKNVAEATNLSVGRMFDVQLKQGDQTLNVPVSVRIISTLVQPDVLVHILGDKSLIKSAKERYHMWRAGQLSFIRDIVLMQDLIDAHKSTLLKDKSGVYEEIMRRRRNNKVSGLLSGAPSIATASNIVVMSRRTANGVESAEGGRFSDPSFRQRVMKDSYLLFLYIVDEDMERVTIYHRDIALPTQLSIKELKLSKGGSDPLEILKAFQLGRPPSI